MIVRIEDPNALVGMELAEAESYIRDHGYESVVINVNGRLRMTPQGGYDPLRIKLSVEEGKVTKAVIG